MRIDPHVHLRDEEQAYKETIAHGLIVAKEQGVDIVFDMPNTAKSIIRREDVERRLKLVPENEKERYFLYIGATSNQEQLKEAIRLVKETKEVVGIKMYAGKSVGNLEITDEKEQEQVYQILADNDYQGVLAVHCEKEIYINNELFNPADAYTHALARPKIAEIESVKDQIKFAKNTNFQGNLHICHITCKESVELVEQARKEIKITCGATPHHLMRSDRMLKTPHGLLYKMNPPLRNDGDVIALREYLKQGKIDWIETDHAPHAIGEKLHKGYPSGYPSLYIYKKCIEEFLPSLGLTEQEINNLTFNNIVKTFKLIF